MLGTGFEHFAEDPLAVGRMSERLTSWNTSAVSLTWCSVLFTAPVPGAGGKSRWFRQDFDVADDWHTYAIEWDETGISWFFDGEEFATIGPENIAR